MENILESIFAEASVYIVDDIIGQEKLVKIINEINPGCIALDCEWTPNFVKNSDHKITVMQMAFL